VIRSSSGFELTLRGRKILEELEQLLPKIEGLVVPSVFDPKRERSNFRISGPGNVCIALLPHLCRRYTTERYMVNFDFLPWQADAVDMLERGKLDLIFHIDEGLLPSHFSSEKLYREDWICAVARVSKFGDRLTLKRYLAAEHLTVTTLPSVQNIPDKQLAALGLKRRSSVRMPYFGAALSCLPGTELVLTLTNGMRQWWKGIPRRGL
jgi:DNA-binding transcriptional LysR family regulator